MALPSTIPKGTILSQKYRVGRELGRGGMAAVYQALNLNIGKRVAIKLLAGHLAASQTVVKRFLREARAVSKIRSPHICEIYDSGRLEDGTPFLVMELLEGESLYDAMCRDRQMSPKLTLAIILQVGRGLARAHEANIVHRDLKPENIFLTVDVDGQLLVKVLDFGLAKFYDSVDSGPGKARLTREGAVFGTPAYMSPEQVRGQAAADTRADLWALACITYECFTGTTVWSTDEGVAMTFAQIATSPIPDPREYRPDLPLSFAAWFDRALGRDIATRFQTVQEFADTLVVAFDYRSTGGGLDIKLVNKITQEAQGKKTPSIQHGQGPQKRPARPPESQQPVSLQPNQAASITMPPPKRGGAWKIVAATLVAGGAIAAAVASKPDTLPAPPEVKRVGPTLSRLAHARTAPTASSGFSYVAKHPWLPRVREAQVLVANGDFGAAKRLLTTLRKDSPHPLLKNMLEQVGVAEEAKSNSARCQVAGYARPRRADLLSQEAKASNASAPYIVRSNEGAVMMWTDTRDRQRRASAVLLDGAMRNRGLPVDITPEGSKISSPKLIPAAKRYLASYLDMGSQKPGVYLRWLRTDAVIDGTPIRVGNKRGIASAIDATRLPDGRFAVAYSDRVDSDSVDLFYRLFDADGKPLGEAVRVTDYVRRGVHPVIVADVRIATLGDKLALAFSYQLGGQRSVRYLAVPIATAPPGLESIPKNQASGRARMLAETVTLSSNNVRAVSPSMACTEQGCFIAWHQTGLMGASVAFVDIASGKRQWHKRFAASGKNPSVASAPNGDVYLAWIDAQRITVGSLDRSGVGPHSKVALTRWGHTPPVITAGAKRGEWYVAWLDFEGGRREPYGARLSCQ